MPTLTVTPTSEETLNKQVEEFANINNPPSDLQYTGPTKPGFGFATPSIPDAVPQTALANDISTTDLFAKRDQMEQAAMTPAAPTVESQLDEVQASTDANIFNNPEAEILSFLNRDQTEAELSQQDILNKQLESVQSISGELTGAQRGAEEVTGFSGLQKDLNDTNVKIANRQKRFREEMRAFEKDATERGVARQFVQGKRQKMEADATAELADLYIVQAAQQGNLTRAESYIKTAVDNRYRAFEIETQARQARLNALLPKLQGEEKERALRLQLALGERSRQIEEKKAEETEIRKLTTEVIANGGSSALAEQILASGSVDAALSMAAPYIGRYERMKVQASLANASLDRRAKLVDLALKGDSAAIAELGDYGTYIQEQLDAAKSEQEAIKFIADQQKRSMDYDLLERKRNLINQMQSNDIGFGLASGTFTSPAAATFGVTVPVATTGGAAIGSAVPGIGTLIGGATGLVTGLASGAYTYSQAKNRKDDYLASVKSLVGQETLDELVRRKAAGATFGALSNEELGILQQASLDLAGRLNKDPVTGNIISINGTPEAIQADINKIVGMYQKAYDGIGRSALSPSEQMELDNL